MNKWYEEHPDLLEKEKLFMNRHFPQFELDQLDDGRIYWVGEIQSSINCDKCYLLMVVYMPYHPYWLMGSSIRVFMISPDEQRYYGTCLRPEDTPFNLCSQTLSDSFGELYQGVWIHKQESPNTASRELSLYLAWLFLRECQIESKVQDFYLLKSIFPSLEQCIRNLLNYGKI